MEKNKTVIAINGVLIFFALLCYIGSCTPISIGKNNAQSIEKTTNDIVWNAVKNKLKGSSWMLQSYIDSIIVNKSVGKGYSAIFPQEALFLCFAQDSLTILGLRSANKIKISSNPDSITSLTFNKLKQFVLTYNIEGDKLYFQKGNIVHHFLPLDTLQQVYFLKTIADIQQRTSYDQLEEDMTNYLGYLLLEGRYLKDGRKGKEVQFKQNGDLVGMGKKSKYKIEPYFGTLHPCNALDVVYITQENQETELYGWEKRNDSLILVKLKQNENTEEWGKEQEVIILKKVK